jgi:hypothetical protein
MKTISKGRSGYWYFYSKLRASDGAWQPHSQRLLDTVEWRGAYASFISHQCMRFSGVVR